TLIRGSSSMQGCPITPKRGRTCREGSARVDAPKTASGPREMPPDIRDWRTKRGRLACAPVGILTAECIRALLAIKSVQNFCEQSSSTFGSAGGFETENLTMSPQLGPSLFTSVTSWSVRLLLLVLLLPLGPFPPLAASATGASTRIAAAAAKRARRVANFVVSTMDLLEGSSPQRTPKLWLCGVPHEC